MCPFPDGVWHCRNRGSVHLQGVLRLVLVDPLGQLLDRGHGLPLRRLQPLCTLGLLCCGCHWCCCLSSRFWADGRSQVALCDDRGGIVFAEMVILVVVLVWPLLSGSMTLSMLSLCMALGGLLAFWLFLSSWRWTTKQNQSQYLHLQSLLVSRVDLSRDTLTLQWKPSASTPSVPGSNLSDHTIIRPPIILKGHFCL